MKINTLKGFKSAITAYYNHNKEKGFKTSHDLIQSYVKNNFSKIDLDLFAYLLNDITLFVFKFLYRKKRMGLNESLRYIN